MNRTARRMNKQLRKGKPTTGKPWYCPMVAGAIVSTFALLATLLVRIFR